MATSEGLANLHPVFADRLGRLLRATGCTVNSGWRSSQEQKRLYEGYVHHRPGFNPANPPGSSYHEAVPFGRPGGLAADLSGDLGAAHARANEFGLHFPIVRVEPWHCQPVECPTARYSGNPLGPVGASGRRQVGEGDSGPEVSEVQARLNVWGTSVSVTGFFGPATAAAVRRFQAAHGLEVDGTVGSSTWAQLTADPVIPVGLGRRPPRAWRLSSIGAALIASFEGLSTRLYDDPSPAHNCTIGIGHLVHPGPTNGSEPANFKAGLTVEEVYDMFHRLDVPAYEQHIYDGIRVPVYQSEFDALVSLDFNVGPAGYPGLRDDLNRGDYPAAAEHFGAYVHAEGRVLEGLVRRRAAESELFRADWALGDTWDFLAPVLINL